MPAHFEILGTDVSPAALFLAMLQVEVEARYAVKHMFGQVRWPMSYRNMSTIMFFNPAASMVL